MAIGSGSEGAQTALQEGYKPDMSLADAEVLALATLKQVMEEKVSARAWRRARARARAARVGACMRVCTAVSRRRCACCLMVAGCRRLHRAAAQVTATNVDIARVAPSYHLYSTEEVEAVIGRL